MNQLSNPKRHAHIHILQEMGMGCFPCGRADGKKPLVEWLRFQTSSPSELEINDWIKDYDDFNIGLVTGKSNGITVIDIDDSNVTDKEAQKIFGECKFIVQTPRGGLHLYYSFIPFSKNKTDYLPKIDVRSEGGYVIFPGGINPKTQESYKIIKGQIKDLRNLSKTTYSFSNPPELLQINAADQSICNNSFSLKNTKIFEGNRNETIFKYLKDAVFEQSDEEIMQMGVEYNLSYCFPPLPHIELKTIVKQIIKYRNEGKLYKKGDRFVQISEFIIHDLIDKPKAY